MKTQNEATQKASRRNFALMQSGGIGAAAAQIEESATKIGGAGCCDVIRCAKKVKDAQDLLDKAIRAWTPNKEEQ